MPSAADRPIMMPNISSPSQSPAIRQHASGSGANAPYGISAYGSGAGGMYPASPSYGVSIGASRPGASPAGAGPKPMGLGAKAYDPAMAAGADAGKNSDSSDSDK